MLVLLILLISCIKPPATKTFVVYADGDTIGTFRAATVESTISNDGGVSRMMIYAYDAQRPP